MPIHSTTYLVLEANANKRDDSLFIPKLSPFHVVSDFVEADKRGQKNPVRKRVAADGTTIERTLGLESKRRTRYFSLIIINLTALAASVAWMYWRSRSTRSRGVPGAPDNRS